MNHPSTVPGEEQVQGDPFSLTQLLICVILPPCLMKDIFGAFKDVGYCIYKYKMCSLSLMILLIKNLQLYERKSVIVKVYMLMTLFIVKAHLTSLFIGQMRT